MIPALREQRDDGLEDEISEEELYRHTRYRWLYSPEFLYSKRLAKARLWEGERASMNLDRGPLTSPLPYMAAMGINKIRWAKQFANSE
ncbi:hypothetical protein CC80DRAFT_493805 [Byssothecium circinans]|uniref:Uncharacterized protein n=1 Tax=Byssothecium circinans TaxID=147558 RepID=A0A6A5TPD3_9PLEO|nr:hypothetical protein CC80DRAFT_493805 [Byssothecium circinans]